MFLSTSILRPSTHPVAGRRQAVITLLAIVAMTAIGIAAYSSVVSSSSAASSPDLELGTHQAPAGPALDGDGDGGRLGDDVTIFDDVPAVTRLDPRLLRALREAAADAALDDITFRINSGWRSRDYQSQLLREAITRYGSKAEAARWVATPDASPHVSGDAVDIADLDAMLWLSEHGAPYGLCQIYWNERWHYELRPEAIDAACPTMYTDPTQDPRMRR